MALAGKSDGEGNRGYRQFRIVKELAGAFNAPLDHVPMGRCPHRGSECFSKMMRAAPGNRSEFDHTEVVGQMRVDVFDDPAQLRRRQPTFAQVCGMRRPSVFAQEMSGQRGGQPLHVEPIACATPAQLMLPERAQPINHRILDADRGPDCEVARLIETIPPDLRDERLVHGEGEERE
jgi:hypothetical protein